MASSTRCGVQRLLRAAYRTQDSVYGPHRGYSVPHLRDATGLGACYTPRSLDLPPVESTRPQAAPILPVKATSEGLVRNEASIQIHFRSPYRSFPCPVRQPCGCQLAGRSRRLRTGRLPSPHAPVRNGPEGWTRGLATSLNRCDFQVAPWMAYSCAPATGDSFSMDIISWRIVSISWRTSIHRPCSMPLLFRGSASP